MELKFYVVWGIQLERVLVFRFKVWIAQKKTNETNGSGAIVIVNKYIYVMHRYIFGFEEIDTFLYITHLIFYLFEYIIGWQYLRGAFVL